MLGHALWERLFHRDPNVLGRMLKLDEQPYTIIGVLPREAVFPPNAELWTPLQASAGEGGGWYLNGVGRLKPGVTIDQARADLLRVHKAMIPTRDVNGVTSPVLASLRDRYLGDFRTIGNILLGGVGVVLLIACVNIAGLMMVRSAARAREIAIRTAVGASRGVIVRQLLTEALVMATLGGILGVLLGAVTLRGMLTLLPSNLPGFLSFGMDWRFALFCLGITAAAAILCGIAPAVQAAGVEPRGWLQDGSRSSISKSRRFTLSAMVVCEIGLALMLLISAGLLLQAFRRVVNVDPGFRPEGAVSYSLLLPRAKYSKPEQGFAFYDQLLEKTRALPGVKAVAATTLVPLSGHSGTFFAVEGFTLGPNDQNPVILQISATPGYFEAVGATFVAGRPFADREGETPATQVAVVNESFAKRFWPAGDPVGKRIRFAWAKEWMQVVGVVKDTKHYGLDQEMRPSVMMPFRQAPRQSMHIVMRTASDPSALIAPARDILRQIDPDLPMFDIRTFAERVDRSLATRRAYSWLFGAFAATAIILAAAGIYGVVSYAVSQRTREIGIRMALGARPQQVMRGVLGSGMILVAIGLVVGVGGALACGRLMTNLLFGVSTTDVLTYGAVIAGVIAVGLLANFVPARRAAAVDPIRALRFE